MSTPALAPAHPAAAHRFPALLRLIVLLLGTLAVAALFTAYLLRNSVVPATRITMPPAPAPYRLLYLRAGQLWSISPGGRQRQVTHVPAMIAARLGSAAVAPDGRHIVLIDGGAVQHAWLLADPGATPRPLLDPLSSATAANRRYMGVVWTGPRQVSLLLAQHDRFWLARYTLAGSGMARQVAWIAVPPQWGQALSLSPDGRQIAMVRARVGDTAFARQVAVRLQSVDGRHASTAYQYLGAGTPGAVLWSPDQGTVVIAAMQGLAIQKSSGRPVRLAVNGTLPATFSVVNAQLAYIAGHPGQWEIHILALHHEFDRVVVTGIQTAPSSLYWTPDARALLYVDGGALWQADPGTGMTQLVAGAVPGTPVQLIAATGAFAR
jgi:hypothetical protein